MQLPHHLNIAAVKSMLLKESDNQLGTLSIFVKVKAILHKTLICAEISLKLHNRTPPMDMEKINLFQLWNSDKIKPMNLTLQLDVVYFLWAESPQWCHPQHARDRSKVPQLTAPIPASLLGITQPKPVNGIVDY